MRLVDYHILLPADITISASTYHIINNNSYIYILYDLNSILGLGLYLRRSVFNLKIFSQTTGQRADNPHGSVEAHSYQVSGSSMSVFFHSVLQNNYVFSNNIDIIS